MLKSCFIYMCACVCLIGTFTTVLIIFFDSTIHIYPVDLNKLFTISFSLFPMKTFLYLAWEEEKEVKPCEIRCVLFKVFVVSQ